ncbi:MAG TPA: hypothetical protein ENI52_06370 [Thermoplasmata archaeon]|nr:hypothetical protein [Thermoplasmata archaeon]
MTVSDCKKTRKFYLSFLIIILSFIIPFSYGKTIYVDDNGNQFYSRIKDAVYSAEDGDIVFVYNGLYHEDFPINKSIHLIGEGKSSTIIDGEIMLTANNIVISNLTIKETDKHPIYNYIPLGDGILIFSDNNIISNCIIKQNMHGIRISSASNNTITGCIITKNNYGIYIEGYSKNNYIHHNNFIKNLIRTIYEDIQVNGNAKVCNIPQIWNTSREGNYWDDYEGPDGNRDGIGDIPYIVGENNKDYYPLITPLDLDGMKSNNTSGFGIISIIGVIIVNLVLANKKR